MAATTNRPQLVAVDANVLFDLAAELDEVVESLTIIGERLRDARLLIPPTVQHELANWSLRGDAQKERIGSQGNSAQSIVAHPSGKPHPGKAWHRRAHRSTNSREEADSRGRAQRLIGAGGIGVAQLFDALDQR